MSFDPRFHNRWDNVILPAIEGIERNGEPLSAVRVDARKIGDSILTAILGGISHAQLIFADITTVATVDGRPLRNGNVMYEVGLAHSVRLPEEVVIFRSDDDSILFDVANVRVNSYDPEANPRDSLAAIQAAMLESLHEIELRRHLSVKLAAESLDVVAFFVLGEAIACGGVTRHPEGSLSKMLSYGPRNEAIIRLLQMGAFSAEFPSVTVDYLNSVDMTSDSLDMIRYKATRFGNAILEYAVREMCGDNPSPELMDVLKRMAGD